MADDQTQRPRAAYIVQQHDHSDGSTIHPTSAQNPYSSWAALQKPEPQVSEPTRVDSDPPPAPRQAGIWKRLMSNESKKAKEPNATKRRYDEMWQAGLGRWVSAIVVLGLAAGIISKGPGSPLLEAAAVNVACVRTSRGILHEKTLTCPGLAALLPPRTDRRPPLAHGRQTADVVLDRPRRVHGHVGRRNGCHVRHDQRQRRVRHRGSRQARSRTAGGRVCWCGRGIGGVSQEHHRRVRMLWRRSSVSMSRFFGCAIADLKKAVLSPAMVVCVQAVQQGRDGRGGQGLSCEAEKEAVRMHII